MPGRRKTARYGRQPVSGVKGVSPTTNGNRWAARLQLSGRMRYLGTFATIHEAASACAVAAREHSEQPATSPRAS